ncbi:Transmembrane GTPase Marf, partial [Trichinella patagoniensis]
LTMDLPPINVNKSTPDSRGRSKSLRPPEAVNASPSPLHKFVEAKGKIKDIFIRTEQCIDKVFRAICEQSFNCDLVDADIVGRVENLKQGISSIGNILSRDHMKVVFFGKTSNGKSTSINAMLRSKVLPTGMGHTTRCFIQVEGTDAAQKYIQFDNCSDKLDVETIHQKASAFCNSDLGEDVMVRLYWPKSDSTLLQNEVVLLDSPGIDVAPQYDEWINKHCGDADVFVFVCNAEATLTETEKSFFRHVKDKLSKPNIFILNNRWDASVDEPEFIDQVREQHMNRCIDFLVNDLQSCTEKEARNRIFFVSSREMLSTRLKQKGIHSPSGASSAPPERFEERCMEFQNFERQFELCISKTAIVTKFYSHVEKGKAICEEVCELLDTLLVKIKAELKEKSERLNGMESSYKSAEEDVVSCLSSASGVVEDLSKKVRKRISSEFDCQTNRFDAMLEHFSREFSSDPDRLKDYKKKLIKFVDNVLNTEFIDSCTGRLLPEVYKEEQSLEMHFLSCLPPSCRDNILSSNPKRAPFKFSFVIPCDQLFKDFEEHLEFQFSLGIAHLMRKLSSYKCLDFHSNKAVQGEEMYAQSSAVVRYASAVADGGVGIVLLLALIKRTVGWPVIVTIISIYELIYLYERLSWNEKAKERKFKRQFSDHLSRKLKIMEVTIISTFQQQIQREIDDLACRLDAVATTALSETKDEIKALEKQVAVLEKVTSEYTPVKKDFVMLQGELENFKNSYLRPYL